MTTNDLIRLLTDKGITLIPQPGGRLDVDGPASVLTSELIDMIRQHKATILRRMAAVEHLSPECRRLGALVFQADTEGMLYRLVARGKPLSPMDLREPS